MALIECCDLWTRFINAAYMPRIEANAGCKFCGSKRCNNHYCLACKEGELCPIKFKANQPHDHHPYLQVRQVTHENVVNVDKLEAFLGANVHKIQKFRGNDKDIVKLKMSYRFGTQTSANVGDNITCGGCGMPYTKTTRLQEGVLVCSIECLINYVERNHQMDHLKLKDGVELQRFDYVHPLTTQEKIDSKRQNKMKKCIDVSKSECTTTMIDDKDNGGGSSLALVPKRKNFKALSIIEKEDDKVVQPAKKNMIDARKSRVSLVASPSEGEAPNYDYSIIPMRYRCADLELLYEVFEM